MAELVTGEAVVLELRVARLATRLLALSLDVLVQVVLLTVGLLVVGGTAAGTDDALAAAVALTVVVLVLVGYPVAFETLSRGRTLGKLALGLRVVRDDGGAIRLRHALMRGLVAVVELYLSFGVIAVFTSLANRQGKRLGDLLAGTLVIRERMPSEGASMAMMPPGLAPWAAGLDLSGLPDELALAARQYLARLPSLRAETAHSMGVSLADAVAGHVSPPPPPGLQPPAYLAAVLAERRGRELARLQGWRVPPAPAPLPSPAPPPGAPQQDGFTPPG